MKRVRTKKSKFVVRYYIYCSVYIILAFVTFGILMLLLICNHWWNEQKSQLGSNAVAIGEEYLSLEASQKKSEIYEKKLILGNSIESFSHALNTSFIVCDTEGNVLVCPEYLKENGKVCAEHENIKVKDNLVERTKTESFASFTSLDGEMGDSFIVATPIEKNGETIVEVFAVVDAITGLLPYVGSIVKIVLVSSLIGILIAFLAIYFYTSKMTKPLGDMIEATDRYAKGDFSYHVKVRGTSKEIDEMASAMNRMVDQLALDNEAQKSFVANVSHELKTPMTTIIGFVDGILDGTIPKEKQAEYLNTVSSEVKRLSRLVVTMLNLSKMEAGEIKLQPIEYNLSSQILEALLSMEQRISSGQIEIEGLEDIADINIYADKDLLHQVIYNLLDNAVKFTPPKGYIKIIAKKSEHYTTVTFRNSGEGLSKEDTARIFERFYKVDKSRSFDVKGVGLGLYIVKTIVNMHEGTIVAQSEQGQYTQFSITLPNK